MQAVWVEIPVEDLARAAAFYQAVFGLSVGEVNDDGTRRTVTLASPSAEGGVGISLNQTAAFLPSDKGPLVYLEAPGEALDRVEASGGKILEGKSSMGDAGSYALILDSEGNQFALFFNA
jgi:predicted enzyme related to lactoylglutathione lyase